MSLPVLSFPRLRVYKLINVGWLIVLFRTETNSWLLNRVTTGNEALALVGDDEWLAQVRQTHGLPAARV